MASQNYRPVESKLAMHQAPRFGHTKEFAAVVSDEGRDDYIDGLVAFAVFIFVLIFVWSMILLVLKFGYGVERVGWAAGGDSVDVESMRKQGINRKRRTHRVRRNWRVQTTFIVASMSIPILSFLLVNHGLEPFIESLSDVDHISNEVDTQAFLGIHAGQRIDAIYRNLQELVSFDVSAACPDFSSSRLNNETRFTARHKEFTKSLNGVSPVVNELIPDTIETLEAVTKATKEAEGIVDFVQSHDWMLIMLLMVLNIINAFFLFGAFLAKNDLDYPVFQAFTGYLLIPAFCLVILASVSTSCLFVAAAISNADFCSGGEGVPNPIGTFQDISIRLGYDEGSLPFNALNYYTSDCHAEHPLALLSEAKRFVETSAESFGRFSSTLNSLNFTGLSSECEGFPFSKSSLEEISENLGYLRENFDQALNLSSCSNLRTIFHFFSSGSVCTDSIDGLKALFSLMFAISVLSLIMLTTRAALFNPVIRAKRIKRREKEFNEYKSYMAKYYDTDLWEMDPPKPLHKTLECFSTMESDDSSSRSIHTASDGTTFDTNCSGMRQSDELVDISQEAECLEERSILSSSSSFFKFRKQQSLRREVEVIYYSSDSDSDDDESVALSLNSSISTLSALIWRGSGQKPVSARKSKSGADGQPSDEADSLHGPNRSNIGLFMKNTAQAIKTPLKNRKRAQPEVQESVEGADLASNHVLSHHEGSRDPLYLGNLEAYLDDSSDVSRHGLFDELPAHPNEPPDAPQKKVSAIARTTGARTID